MRKSLFLLSLMAIYMGLVGVEKSYAWGKTWLGRDLERQIDSASFNLGPFRIYPRFVLSNAGYDSDIYYGATPEPVKDYTFTAGPAFNVYLPLKKRIIFHIYESPQYVYFKETARERNWDNYFQGQVHFLFNRFVVTAGMEKSQARQRWNTEIDIRLLRKVDAVQGSLLWQPTARMSFDFSYRTARYDYGESNLENFSFAERLNRDETLLNFTAYRDITSRTRFFLDAEYGFFDFANPSTMKNSKSYGGYGGFEFSPFGKVRGKVKVGYKYFNSLSPERKDYKGIVGDSSVSVRLMRPLTVRASYRRDVQFSVWFDNTYFLEDTYGVGGSIYLFRNIRLDYDYYRGRNSYPEDLGAEKRLDDYRVPCGGHIPQA